MLYSPKDLIHRNTSQTQDILDLYKDVHSSPKELAISDEDLQTLLAQIKQVSTYKGTGESLYYVDPVDPRTRACTWDMSLGKEAPGLQALMTKETLHHFGAPSLFKPSIAEVLVQAPLLLCGIVAFQIHKETVYPCARGGKSVHAVKTTFYTRDMNYVRGMKGMRDLESGSGSALEDMKSLGNQNPVIDTKTPLLDRTITVQEFLDSLDVLAVVHGHVPITISQADLEYHFHITSGSFVLFDAGSARVDITCELRGIYFDFTANIIQTHEHIRSVLAGDHDRVRRDLAKCQEVLDLFRKTYGSNYLRFNR